MLEIPHGGLIVTHFQCWSPQSWLNTSDIIETCDEKARGMRYSMVFPYLIRETNPAYATIGKSNQTVHGETHLRSSHSESLESKKTSSEITSDSHNAKPQILNFCMSWVFLPSGELT